MQAAPATVVPLPYPAGMQATSPQQQQQVYPQPGQQVVLQHQLPPQQAAVPQQAQMPAAPQQQDGYGAAAGAGALHSMPLANNFNHTAPSLSGQKRDSSGAPVHGGHGASFPWLSTLELVTLCFKCFLDALSLVPRSLRRPWSEIPLSVFLY
jgi:hypothetical protein